MKNIARILTVISFLLLTIWACDKEVGVISSFDFALEESHEEIATINLPQKTTLTIRPEKEVTTNTYKMKYEVLSGDGNYIETDGSVIPQNEFIPLSALSTDLRYKGTSINVDKVKVTVEDSDEKSEAIEINYNVQHNEYSLDVSTPVNMVNVNSVKSFSYTLLNIGKDKEVSYERAFYIIQGSGKVLNSDGSNEIELEKYKVIGGGTHNHHIQFTEPGESKLMISTRDSNGQIKNDTLTYQVSIVDFSFTATREKNNIFINEDININFALNENQGSGGQYKMYYVVNEGDVNVSSGGVSIESGTPTNISLGNFSWNLRAESELPINISFFVSNESGAELKRNIDINVVPGSFEFNPIPVSNSQSLNEDIIFNTSITEDGPSDSPYSLSFSSTGTGVVSYNGKEYTAGQKIENLTDLNFSFSYKGTTSGKHQITFILTNSKNVSREVIRTVDFVSSEFKFSGSLAKTEIFTNEAVDINFTVTETTGNSDYQMQFIIENGSGVTIRDDNGDVKSSGTLYNVNSGNFTWTLEGENTGDFSARFIVQNSENVEKNISVFATIKNISYDFSIVFANSSSAFVGTTMPMTATINENPISQSTTYTLIHNVLGADNGDIEYRGTTYSQGEAIAIDNSDIDSGPIVFQYIGRNIGTHDVDFKIISSLNREITKSLSPTINSTFNDVVDNHQAIDFVTTGFPSWFGTTNSIKDYQVKWEVISEKGTGSNFRNTAKAELIGWDIQEGKIVELGTKINPLNINTFKSNPSGQGKCAIQWTVERGTFVQATTEVIIKITLKTVDEEIEFFLTLTGK
ncbi:MAG: TraQ conjugal transfer family protein [Melioribacteraceae bacterium]|nr:TraQ conjugal transfer family protein [Melioribacteraceae bacterium]